MKIIRNLKRSTLFGTFLALASFVLFLGPSPALAQNQSADTGSDAQPLPGYPVQPPAGQAPAASSQEQQPPAAAPAQPASPTQAAPAPQAAAPANQPVPAQLTIPSGFVIPVRVNGWISSEQNHPGDTFSASLDQPLVANGWLLARKGQTVIGRVTTVKKSGHFGGVSELGLELSMVTMVDGQQVNVQTKLVQNSGRSTAGPDVAVVGATTGVGAAVGAAAGGGYGAGVGAGIGAIAGIAGVMTSRGAPTVVRPEALLSFQLASPITINTEHSQVAFQPVRPSDYRGDQDAYAPGNQPRLRGPDGPAGEYPPPVAYPYPYPYAYPYYPYYGGGFYPGPVVGFGFGFGPRYGYYRGFRR